MNCEEDSQKRNSEKVNIPKVKFLHDLILFGIGTVGSIKWFFVNNFVFN